MSTLKPAGRRSQTTSPAVSVHDEWDTQLMMQLGSSSSPGTASPSNFKRPSVSGGAAATGAGTTSGGLHSSNGGGLHHPATSASLHAAPPATAPGVSRYLKEQMIRAAVSAMIQCGVPVSPGMLDFRGRSEADLDATLLQLMVGANQPPPQPRPTLTHIEREIYFDPQLINSNPADGRYNNMIGASASRPHAPIIMPAAYGAAHSRTPGGAAQPSPTMLTRFSTPATKDAAGALFMEHFAAAGSPAPFAATAAAPPNKDHKASAASSSDSGSTNAVKPRAHRAPYDPRLFPRDLCNDVNIQNVRRHVGRSVSSAFSQHSTQSSQLTAPTTNMRNLSEDVMFGSASQ